MELKSKIVNGDYQLVTLSLPTENNEVLLIGGIQYPTFFLYTILYKTKPRKGLRNLTTRLIGNHSMEISLSLLEPHLFFTFTYFILNQNGSGFPKAKSLRS